MRFELGKIICRNHRYAFQDHIKYIHNDIVNTLRVGIIQYDERICEMHDLYKYPPPPWIKGDSYDQADWTIRNKEFSECEISVETRYGLPTSMQDEIDDKDQ